MLQTELTSISIGILNRECAVRPPSRRVAAMPDEAMARAIFPADLTLAKTVFSTKVFPLPPQPSRKKTPPVLALTASVNTVAAAS